MKIHESQFDAAFTDADKAVQLNPNSDFALDTRLTVEQCQGNLKKVREDCQAMFPLRPDCPRYRQALAFNWIMSGNDDKALVELEEVIFLAPDRDNAYAMRACILATSLDDDLRDGVHAIVDAQRACELAKTEKPGNYEVLAAAYAEQGKLGGRNRSRATRSKKSLKPIPKYKASDDDWSRPLRATGGRFMSRISHFAEPTANGGESSDPAKPMYKPEDFPLPATNE